MTCTYLQQFLVTGEHSESRNECYTFAKRGCFGLKIGKIGCLIFYLHNDVVFFSLRMLRSNRISCVGNDSFTGLSSVRLLSLYDNQITTIAPGAFDTLHSLSTL